MIISKSPLRLSFIGGGSDFRAHFSKHGGAVLSAAIDKYVYVTVSPSFDGRVHLHYSRIEVVDDASELQHDIVRAALAQAGISRGVEIHTIADVTGEGTGLGSSSALAVGLVNALAHYQGPALFSAPQEEQWLHTEWVAKKACEIEIDILHKPIGEQDQWIAALGGLRLIEWDSTPDCDYHQRKQFADGLSKYILLFDTGIKRNSHEILIEQSEKVESNELFLSSLALMARNGHDLLLKGDCKTFGELVGAAWIMKKQLSSGITNPTISSMYSHARIAGAWGGKICGAGGGGYLLLIAPPDAHARIRSTLALPEMRVKLGVDGSVAREI